MNSLVERGQSSYVQEAETLAAPIGGFVVYTCSALPIGSITSSGRKQQQEHVFFTVCLRESRRQVM